MEGGKGEGGREEKEGASEGARKRKSEGGRERRLCALGESEREPQKLG